MKKSQPHYLLFSAAVKGSPDADKWHFALESVDGDERFAAAAEELGAEADRLELLAVVRGLEALEQPSRVTLVTRSRYVSRGLRRGLREWKSGQWRWERFGRRVPIRDRDLWQRIDRALEFHHVQCRTWATQPAADEPPRPASGTRCRPPRRTRSCRPDGASSGERHRQHNPRRGGGQFAGRGSSSSHSTVAGPMSRLGQLAAAAVISLLALARLAISPFSAGV